MNPPLIFFANLVIAVLCASIFGVIAWRIKWLTAAGAVSAAFMGIIIWVAGGFKAALPILLFFVTGSYFSRLAKNNIVALDKNSIEPRNFMQVVCNGGIATLCILAWLISRKNEFLPAYFLSISISTADTWSSELGMRWKGKTIDIISLKPIVAGLSGGISLKGNLAGLLGSLLIGAVYYWMFDSTILELTIIVSGGFTGMLIDSILGSTLQAKYRLKDRSLRESKKEGEGILESGVSWMTNDWVNLLSNFIGTLCGLLLLLLYKTA